jgi:hypothetical protein
MFRHQTFLLICSVVLVAFVNGMLIKILIFCYKNTIRRWVALVVGQTTSAITADFGSMEFFFASNKRCLSQNKSGNLICRGFFFFFSELFELTLTDLQLAPPGGESRFKLHVYMARGEWL